MAPEHDFSFEGEHAMHKSLGEVFRDAIDKSKELGTWEQMTMKQKEELVSKYLLEYFNNKRKRLKAAVTDRY